MKIPENYGAVTPNPQIMQNPQVNPYGQMQQMQSNPTPQVMPTMQNPQVNPYGQSNPNPQVMPTAQPNPYGDAGQFGQMQNPQPNSYSMGQFGTSAPTPQPMQGADVGQFGASTPTPQPMQSNPTSFGDMGQFGVSPQQMQSNPISFGDMGQFGQPAPQSMQNAQANMYGDMGQFGQPTTQATQSTQTSFGEQTAQSATKTKAPKEPKASRGKLDWSSISFSLLISMLWKSFVKPKELFEEIMEEGNLLTGIVAIIFPSVVMGLLSQLLLSSVFGSFFGSGFSLTIVFTILIFAIANGAICTFAYYVTAKNIAKVDYLTIDRAVAVAGAFSLMSFSVMTVGALIGFVSNLLSSLVSLASGFFITVFGIACHKSDSKGATAGSFVLQFVIQGVFVMISGLIIFSTILSGFSRSFLF